MNYSKSSIYLSPNASPELEAEIGVSSWDQPNHRSWRLPWDPSNLGQIKKESSRYICDRIQKMVHGWKASSLTMAGSEVLIKSVALAIPTYLRSCFKFPSSTCKAINGNPSRFWWGLHDNRGNKIYWKSWEHISLSESDGGMGFRDIETFTLAVLANQCWRLE